MLCYSISPSDGPAHRQRKERRWAGRLTAGLARGWAAALLLLGALAGNASADGVLAQETVVVDPGHGGVDGGALGNGLEEKDITLAIGRALGADLRAAGARVVLTRAADQTIGPAGHVTEGLADRAALANRLGADVFVSVHANALNDPTVRGVMTFYGLASGYVGGVVRSGRLVGLSRRLADDVQAGMVRQTGAVDAGVSGADFYVLGYADMPAVLVETGFLTNAGEAAQLASPSYQWAVAAGISRGITRFLNEPAASAAVTTTPTTAPGAGGSTYVVRRGDTLIALAKRLGVGEAALADANKLADSDMIRAGQTLRLPADAVLGGAAGSTAGDSGTAAAQAAPVAYTVRRGDTLSALALRFGVSQAALLRANRLRSPDRLLAGQQLRVPGGAGTGDAAASGAASGGAAPTGQVYRVRPGDTLSALALRFGVDEATLAAANGIRNPDHLIAGQALRLAGMEGGGDGR